uniref:Uncharacterized protein n=1 Tax=Arundo donax TaxID=35708 RepID=A0A0A9HUS4_ARUDO
MIPASPILAFYSSCSTSNELIHLFC